VVEVGRFGVKASDLILIKRGSEKLLKYNEDQPRDENGRFTDGGSNLGRDLSPEERAERLASSEYVAGKGVLLTEEEKQKFMVDKIQTAIDRYRLNPRVAGFTDQQIARLLYLGWADQGGAEKSDWLVFSKGLVWKNGDTIIYATTGKSEKDGSLEALTQNLDRMQEYAPVDKLDVFVGYPAIGGNVYARASYDAEMVLGRQQTPELYLAAGKAMQQYESAPDGNGWFSPSASTGMNRLEYVMAHEWGHLATDTSKAEELARAVAEESPISRYGQKDSYEYAAECFAEYYFTNGQSEDAGVQRVAQIMGWAK